MTQKAMQAFNNYDLPNFPHTPLLPARTSSRPPLQLNAQPLLWTVTAGERGQTASATARGL